jgi:2,4-dienoyl-CoA reductase-like NADH-dependent reductase (Old Yellow Enzyme family)
MDHNPLLQPLEFKKHSKLTVKNRIFRSSISGRFDNYDGSGTQVRVNWEEKFAKGGVGAIITSFVPVSLRGRILPNYATIDRDERIDFWARVVERVHAHQCAFLIQLSHSGRQRDNEGAENFYRRALDGEKPLSSTGSRDPLHGFPCQPLSKPEIKELVQLFANAARRAQQAGADGIETHSANGYLFTQFLSAGINHRSDEYGGTLRNRARFLLEVIGAIREAVGSDFHFQVKLSAVDRNNAVLPWEHAGNKLDDTLQVCQWVEEAGASAIHVSSGSSFPHPLNPPGEMPVEVLSRTYETVISTGELTRRNFAFFGTAIGRWLFRWAWDRIKARNPGVRLRDAVHTISSAVPPGDMQERLRRYQGVSLAEAKAIKAAVGIPVVCTGGFQQASYINAAILGGYCDAVAIARPLIANNDLVKHFEAGRDLPPRPCTYCNKCLIHDIEDPLGCYELARYGGDDRRMFDEINKVFSPGFPGAPEPVQLSS